MPRIRASYKWLNQSRFIVALALSSESEINLEQPTIPVSVLLSEKAVAAPERTEGYKLTETRRPIYEKARLATRADRVTCLIRGEHGTGREHLARELENLVRQLAVFTQDLVQAKDLPAKVRTPDSETGLESFHWREHEKALITKALVYYKGNQSRTCEAMGYGSVNTFKKRLAEYGIAV